MAVPGNINPYTCGTHCKRLSVGVYGFMSDITVIDVSRDVVADDCAGHVNRIG